MGDVQPVEPNPPATHAEPRAIGTEVRRAMLERAGMLDQQQPGLDRWTAVLRRATGVSVAAIAVPLGNRTLIRSMWTAAGAEAESAEIPAGASLEEFLNGKVDSLSWPDEFRSYLEMPIAVDDHVLSTDGPAGGQSP